MAISPEKLISSFENPNLSEKDKKSVESISKQIDNDIIKHYGHRYNRGDSTVNDGFKCVIYLTTKIDNYRFDNDTLSKAYLLNSYRNVGWDIVVNMGSSRVQWDLTFNKSKIRDKTIDSILKYED